MQNVHFSAMTVIHEIPNNIVDYFEKYKQMKTHEKYESRVRTSTNFEFYLRYLMVEFCD